MLVKGIKSLMLYPGLSLGSGKELVIPQRAQDTMIRIMKFMVKELIFGFSVWWMP